MPILEPSLDALPPPERFLDVYTSFPYGFTTHVKTLSRYYHICAHPRKYAQMLQLIVGRPWKIDYVMSADTNEFRSKFGYGLQRIAAPMLLHLQGKDLGLLDNPIRLTWHTIGEQKSRWNYKEAYMPNFFHVDRKGYSGWSEMTDVSVAEIDAIPLDVAEDFYSNKVVPYNATKRTKYKQDDAVAFEGSDFVFMPLQVIDDSVMQLSYFKNYPELIAKVAETCRKMGRQLVVKRHPKCSSDVIAATLNRLQNENVTITSASIHKILPKAKAVVVVNSGVGFEALLHLKGVVCLGKADYAAAGFSAKTNDEIGPAIESAISAVNQNRIKRLLFLTLNKYQLNLESADAVDRQILRLLCRAYLDDQ